ncbi:hypothetical protein PTTG_25752 [Puccinia triticina 1-1 BBBD Race 1]|uniref:REM-1 domain-containing protein n=2 Tax=Puccinia triticina TaxID=208348 RepID=A0A180H152_PUCT1|nr:hypothetical protein PTTG_25752 [Puccinia triticina 1-1 BBBD Race 1]
MDRAAIHQQQQQSSTNSNSFSSLNNLNNSTATNIQPSASQLILDSPEPPITPSKDHLKEQLAALRVKLERAEAIQRGAENLLHQVGAGQGLKRKDNDLSSQPNSSIGGSSTTTTASTLHASVEAELDLANRNVKALVKEIEALEALSATSPRKGRRRLKTNDSAQSNPPTQIFPDDNVRIQSEIEELIKQFVNEESLSEPQLRKLSDLVKGQRGHSKLNRRKLIEIGLLGLTDSCTTEVRAESYRLLRHAAHTLVDMNVLRLSRVEFFIIKTLARDHKHDYEKLQALILVRSVACHPRFLTLCIARAIVAIAETAEEKLRQLAIETLGELMVRDFELLSQADGIKVVMQSLTDPSGGLKELAPYMASLVMAMVDRPVCRQYLKPGVDFESALAAITEVNEPSSSQAQDERVRTSVKLVVLLLKSWTGLMFLCLNKKRSLRMYVQSMKVPSDSIRLILIDALFEIFQIKTPQWFSTFMSGKRLTYYQKPGTQPVQSSQPPINKDLPEKTSERATLADHYLAILLLVFFDVKLLETLIEITESKGTRDEPVPGSTTTKQANLNIALASKSSVVRKKASLLIAEILDLSNRILPLRYGTRIQSLPRLFELAASFQQGDHRSTGTAALREVDSLHRTKNRLASPFLTSRGDPGSNSSHWDDVSLFRSFGIGSMGLTSVGGVSGSATATSVNGLLSAVSNSESASKVGGSGVMGSSASVNGLASGLSLITGVSSTTTGSGNGTSGLGSVGGVAGNVSAGSDPPQNAKLLPHSDPRFRLHFMNIDDVSFRNLVIETQVLVTKDHTRWNLVKLLELIEGTLYMNPKRLEELTRSTKVMKRLLGFLHPFEGRYPYIKRTKHTSRYTKLACSTLQTLLSDPVGVKFLSEDKLVEQIGLGLRQLDQHTGAQSNEVLFSQSRVEDTLTHGYFEMLGVLSKYPEGIKLMEKFKIFTSFYALCEMRTRDDLVKQVIENVDYSINGHCRLVLSKALTSSYKHVRLFATHHLEKLISRADFSLSGSPYPPVNSVPANSPTAINDAKTWSIRLLLTQLYDPSPEVCGLAVEILEEACAGSIEVLETVVKMRPSVENLGDVGAPLLLRFLSTSVGARYLNEIEWTEREMDDWFQERNRDYVIQLEVYLSKLLNADGTRDEEDDELIASVDGSPPPHFYGELVKTAEGRELLTAKGHFDEFVKTIRQHGREECDLEVINQVKTALWAIGNIGASVGGLTFLEAECVVDDVVSIAESSNVFSVRGTCYFVLGLISLTSEGSELLEDAGWATVQTPLGMITGICVPTRLNEFIVNPTWKPKKKKLPDLSTRYTPFKSPIHRKILIAIANLSNHLLANNSSKTLARLKAKHREAFQDLGLFHRALKILGNYHYRLMTRRFVMELFGDIKLDSTSARKIHEAGESMKSSRADTSRTITHDISPVNVGSEQATTLPEKNDGNVDEEEEESEEESEESETYESVRMEDLPVRSGSCLLEAYDKTDYCSDDDEEDGEDEEIEANGTENGTSLVPTDHSPASRPAALVPPRSSVGDAKLRDRLPMVTVRGFMVS